MLQHKVSWLSLGDITKHGHRNILATFLVNAPKSITYTENVLWPRFGWCAEGIRNTEHFAALLPEIF